jgi:hypothetical protein
VKQDYLSKLILFGESSLKRALTEFAEHYHAERNHQGKGEAWWAVQILCSRRMNDLTITSRSLLYTNQDENIKHKENFARFLPIGLQRFEIRNELHAFH